MKAFAARTCIVTMPGDSETGHCPMDIMAMSAQSGTNKGDKKAQYHRQNYPLLQKTLLIYRHDAEILLSRLGQRKQISREVLHQDARPAFFKLWLLILAPVGKGFGLANMEWKIPDSLDTKFLDASH